MRRRSRAGGEPAKAQRRKTGARKSRITPKAVRPRSSSAAPGETKVARLTRERDEALQRQTAIANENTRLLNELRQRTTDLTERTADLAEALKQQTATSEVLQVISSFPGDLEPVFASMLENAVRICDAKFGNIFRWDGEALHLAATHNTSPAYAEARRRSPLRSGPNEPIGRMVATKSVVHVADLAADPGYIERRIPAMVDAVELGGVRTFLAVPMLKENELIGAFTLSRQEVRPFTDKQIALVTNFAAQAVIAIENTRLLNELRQRTTDLSESLERQTATSEVLQVISSSPGDLEPVFAAMLAKAVRICDAKFGILYLREGRGFRLAAAHDVPPAYAKARGAGAIPPVPGGVLESIMKTGRTMQLPDVATLQSYAEGHPLAVAAVEVAGMRSLFGVPMLRENQLIGVIAIYRQEVRPFTDKQIELVQNFAAQAVIAIENARLLNELRQRTTDLTERTADLSEALEQQTATSEVLQVISSSPGDLEPVFAAMREKAVRMCDASFGNIYRWQDGALHLVAAHNTPPALAQARRRFPLVPRQHPPIDHMVATKAASHVIDAATTSEYIERTSPGVVEVVELGGVRTALAVPMVRDNELIGSLTVYRQEVRPFTDKQIELVTNFAAQAVIAIENARLLSELRESLQQQTATADVLKVISRSTFDLQAVFATLVESAARLCRADKATITWLKEHQLPVVAAYGFSDEFTEYIRTRGAERRTEAANGRRFL